MALACGLLWDRWCLRQRRSRRVSLRYERSENMNLPGLRLLAAGLGKVRRVCMVRREAQTYTWFNVLNRIELRVRERSLGPLVGPALVHCSHRRRESLDSFRKAGAAINPGLKKPGVSGLTFAFVDRTPRK